MCPAGLVVAMALIIAGCSSAGTVDGPVLTSSGPSPFGAGGMDATLEGVLDFDGDCLRLIQEGIEYPVVWPAGASWQPDPPSVVLDRESIEPGATVTGAGGFLSRDHVEQLAGSQVADAAERCAGATGEIAFFQHRIEGRGQIGLAQTSSFDMQVETCLWSRLEVDVYRAIADPTRRLIMDELADRDDQTLFELCTRLTTKHGVDSSRQAISQHLEVLEAAGLITTRREGRYKFHQLQTGPLGEISRRWPSSREDQQP